ncbi:MAG: hypothetical protein HY043_14370 [Verrucomicrobia bacterium]|nr:hypothetical protein [Verrucomicrobiota bacterium]
MSKRTRPIFAGASVRSKSGKFLWHLLPPWKASFSHKHWWSEEAEKVELEAAIWELLRRHPFTEWFKIGCLVDWEFNFDGENWSRKEQFLKDNLDRYWLRRRKDFLSLIMDSPVFSDKRRAKDLLELSLGAYAFCSWVELPKRVQVSWKKQVVHQLDQQRGFRPSLSHRFSVLPDFGKMSEKSLAKLRTCAETLPFNFWQGSIPSINLESDVSEHRTGHVQPFC